MPKSMEEEYEEALKGYDHPRLAELYKRDPVLLTMSFEAGMYEWLQARLHPETAANAEEEQPPTT